MLALGVLAATAQATQVNSPSRYTLRHPKRERCRDGFARKVVLSSRHVHRRRVTSRRVVCVRRISARREAPAAHLRTRIDPTFKRSPTNPLAVTYSFSASALEGEHAAPLPSGVLDLYSDGLLRCSINVGGTISGGTCAVTYETFGVHTVIVKLTAEAASATETSNEDIEPYATTTALTLHGPFECESTPEAESCGYEAEVATVDENGDIPAEGSDEIAIEKSPEQEFTPAISPVRLRGPIAFRLTRTHVEGGWICSLRYGSVIETFGGPVAFVYPTPCGTTMAAYADFSDYNRLWAPSRTVSQPVVF